jgi:hypothetical protein
MSSTENRTKVLLAMQAALLGAVVRKMVAVVVRWDASTVRFRAIFDSPLGEEEVETTSAIESELISHFPEFEVRGLAQLRSSAGLVELDAGEVLVFSRAE